MWAINDITFFGIYEYCFAYILSVNFVFETDKTWVKFMIDGSVQ